MRASRPIAADTNVLLDYANGEEFAADCFATIRQRIPGSAVIILPTVIQELAHLVDDPDEPSDIRLAATATLSRLLHEWRLQPVNCVPVGHGIVEETALGAGLPPGDEFNDALILAEAALLGASILLTSDRHLLDIDPGKLTEVLESCDLAVPLIASPRKIVRHYFR